MKIKGDVLTNGTWTYTWRNGRELETMSNGTVTWRYTYDANGMRTSRTNGSYTYRYVYNGGQLVQMKMGGHTLNMTYDANGTPMTVTFDGTEYYYITNLQGDVMGIADSSGTMVVSYTYDAWGKLLSTTGSMTNTLGAVNPIRYRGYVYDYETGYYYLQSRYYDPKIGRFINADGLIATGQGLLGNNMFAYCGNSPVNRVDYAGQFWEEIWEFIQTAVSEIGKAAGDMAPAYAGCGGAAVVDGPLPFGDIVAVAGATLLTVSAIGIGLYQTAKRPSVSVPKVEEKAEVIVIPKGNDRPVIFPLDPNKFNPLGLRKEVRPGTYNGMIISWREPKTNIEVFRWDENSERSNGPHYHVMLFSNTHFYAGEPVPEIFAKRYFPFGI